MKHNQYSRATVVVTAIIVYIFIYAAIALLWVGAEVIFEGAVAPSKVDSVIAGIMAYYCTKDLFKKQEVTKNGTD